MFKKAYIETELEFSTALATLSIVQNVFSQEQDTPPTDAAIFWALERVRMDIERIKEKLLGDAVTVPAVC